MGDLETNIGMAPSNNTVSAVSDHRCPAKPFLILPFAPPLLGMVGYLAR